jgi:hypothetical protein
MGAGKTTLKKMVSQSEFWRRHGQVGREGGRGGREGGREDTP